MYVSAEAQSGPAFRTRDFLEAWERDTDCETDSLKTKEDTASSVQARRQLVFAFQE